MTPIETKKPKFREKQQVFFPIFYKANSEDISHAVIRQGKLVKIRPSEVVRKVITEYEDRKKWFRIEKVEVQREENELIPAKYWVQIDDRVYELSQVFATKQALFNSL